jgi:hypothetical protein
MEVGMKKESKGTITYKTTLEWKEIPNSKCSAYKRVIKYNSDFHIPDLTVEHIALTEELEKVDLNNFTVTILDFTYLPKEALEIYRTKGWQYQSEDKELDKYFRFAEKPFTYFDKLNTLVQLDGSSHMVFSPDKEPYPVAIYFEYIEGHTDNRSYDLPKLHSYLRKRKDIKNLAQVEDIPYYNRDEDRTECISFTWIPSAKDYSKMWKVCLKDKEYPSCRMRSAIEDLDLLGMNKFKHDPKKKCCW